MIFKKGKTNIGLDIGSSSVKVVELSQQGANYELLNYGIKNFNNGADEATLTNAIRQVLEEANISARTINTSLAGQDIVVRIVEMAKMSEKELRSSIKFEAEKYIPFNINDMILDFQILQSAPASSKMRVLLVAAKKDRVDRHIRLLKEAGLTPRLIDVDAFAILNTFNLKKPDNNMPFAVLDIGAKITNIIVANSQTVYVTRDILIAGEEIKKTLSLKTGLDVEKIDENQCSYDELFQSIKTVIDNLINEVRVSFHYCEHQLESPIKTVYLTGGTSMLKCLDLYLSEGLGMQVSVWNPLANIGLRQEMPPDKANEFSSKLTVALGLAMRG